MPVFPFVHRFYKIGKSIISKRLPTKTISVKSVVQAIMLTGTIEVLAVDTFSLGPFAQLLISSRKNNCSVYIKWKTQGLLKYTDDIL